MERQASDSFDLAVTAEKSDTEALVGGCKGARNG
jgi:hypothetical protein